MRTAIVLFTRNLRVHDNPALAAAVAAAQRVVPLFVFDRAVLARFGAPNRVAYLLDALADLDDSLSGRGGALFVREGEVVEEVMRIARETGAEAVYAGEDVSAYAQARERRLRAACDAGRLAFHAMPGATVIPPGDLAPARAACYRMFTPYWRRWHVAARRPPAATPRRIVVPERLARGRAPALRRLVPGAPSRGVPAGGEAEARRRLTRWLARGLADYERLHDDLAADGTSRLSAHLHFGCLSPLEVVERASGIAGAEPFLRQLCWRDFYAQLLAARPETSHEDFNSRGHRWRTDEADLDAWKEGRTGYPIIDAGMRQLAHEGFMHNRTRLLTASFLTKDLYIDWRLGAAHFADLLVDGDVANNSGNWQWVAGTGVDTRPNRVFNPIAQARRFDPSGDYVRRYVAELAGVKGDAVHEPWKLARMPRGYPQPIVDHGEAVARLRSPKATSSKATSRKANSRK
jgi:deoxyribodipyrimidine photo-lyase